MKGSASSLNIDMVQTGSWMFANVGERREGGELASKSCGKMLCAFRVYLFFSLR